MHKPSSLLSLIVLLVATPLSTQAGNRGNAVIGSIIGGATGAVIGNNLGGRDGAIVGGALGAAAGVAIATDHNNDHASRDDRRYSAPQYNNHYNGYGRRHGHGGYIVESPRHYYQGNDFVYGVPQRHDNGRRHGRERHHHHHEREVVIIHQPAPRYYDDQWRPRGW